MGPRDLYCFVGAMGWVLGLFGTSVGLGYLGQTLQCGGEPRVLSCRQSSESQPDETAYATLTDFTPLLDAAACLSYDNGNTYSARVPLVPSSAEQRGESVRVIAVVSGIRTREELAAAFAGKELTGLLRARGRIWAPEELWSTCPGIQTEICRQLNVDHHPTSAAFGAGIALAALLAFGFGLVALVHGLFGIPDQRPLNGVFIVIPLVDIVQGFGWLWRKQPLLPPDAAPPLAIGTGVFLLGTGAMQLHEQGLASLDPYTPGPLSAFLIDGGFALLLLGVYFYLRCQRKAAESAPV